MSQVSSIEKAPEPHQARRMLRPIGGLPRQLLDVTKTTVPQQAITDANDLESPLLALPAEIWIRIFEYVLGGFSIDVTPYYARPGSPPVVRFCANPENCPNASLASPDAFRQCDDSQLEDVKRTLDHRRHDECQPLLSTHLARPNLNILQVCRRIHLEAALLPFQKNTFTIHIAEPFALALTIYPTFRIFLHNLAQEQREALAHLTVTSISCFLAENKGQLARLKDLRTLHVVQKPNKGLNPIYAALVSCWENAGGRPREWRRLQLAHLENVRVSIEVRFWKTNEAVEKFQRSVVGPQTRPLTGLLGMVEGRLFESIAGRVIPGEPRGEDGDRFEEKLSSMRGFYR